MSFEAIHETIGTITHRLNDLASKPMLVLVKTDRRYALITTSLSYICVVHVSPQHLFIQLRSFDSILVLDDNLCFVANLIYIFFLIAYEYSGKSSNLSTINCQTDRIPLFRYHNKEREREKSIKALFYQTNRSFHNKDEMSKEVIVALFRIFVSTTGLYGSDESSQ
uniref:Uncharacterized protein n=1 Tax=Glossina austeni TaxID=7395 RepID=A0A1A9VUA5_GLOAU